MFKRITLLAASCFVVLSASAQLTITGTVTDEQDQPLAGANVVIVQTFIGTVTKSDGTFFLGNLKPHAYTLKVSFVGFRTLDVPVEPGASRDLKIKLRPSDALADEVVIRGIRASANEPVTFSTVSREELKNDVMIRDIPYLLQNTPSLVATSDGGLGVGYSALRIRGTDPSRINVTINGIPFNDPESHEVYWVDIPDLASSTENIQVQRGVGSSTQGAAAFGANINFRTTGVETAPSAELNTSAGSFNTWKTAINAGTGRIGDHFNVEVRLSKVHSDGFIDRAFTDLGSAYLSGSYSSAKSIVRATFFTGKERTYQAWGGVPSELLKTDRTYNPYTYENEVDDYLQNNAQLQWSCQPVKRLDFSVALHYTGGAGYYEQYREGEALADYRIAPVIIGGDTILESDLVRRKWLKNKFVGGVYSVNYHRSDWTVTAGGGWNRYSGDHFGRVIWARFASDAGPDHPYYFSNGLKTDFNQYLKTDVRVLGKVWLYADLQFRHIDYRIDGTDDNLSDVSQVHRYDFFNPKVGLTWDITSRQNVYASYSIAHREPTRGNFIDAPANQVIRPEMLRDLEAGYRLNGHPVGADLTFYYMDYRDQLILTGQINDVGAPIMVNIPSSYRTGIEMSLKINPLRMLQVEGNLTLSRNKIRDFTEYVDDWDTGGQQVQHLGTTDLALSPEVITGGRVTWQILDDLRFILDSRYVGRQYVDNTSSPDRSIDPYWVSNVSLDWMLKLRGIRELDILLQVNNVFNAQYETNAWVYSYYYGGERYKMDGYFPQAGINFMAGLRIRL